MLLSSGAARSTLLIPRQLRRSYAARIGGRSTGSFVKRENERGNKLAAPFQARTVSLA